MRAAAALPAGELRPARGAPRGNLDVVARGKDEGSWRVVGQSPDDAGDWQRSDLSIGRRGGAGSIAWAEAHRSGCGPESMAGGRPRIWWLEVEVGRGWLGRRGSVADAGEV